MSKSYGVLKELFIIRQITTIYYHTTPHPPSPFCRITERLVEICRKTNYLKAFHSLLILPSLPLIPTLTELSTNFTFYIIPKKNPK